MRELLRNEARNGPCRDRDHKRCSSSHAKGRGAIEEKASVKVKRIAWFECNLERDVLDRRRKNKTIITGWREEGVKDRVGSLTRDRRDAQPRDRLSPKGVKLMKLITLAAPTGNRETFYIGSGVYVNCSGRRRNKEA